MSRLISLRLMVSAALALIAAPASAVQSPSGAPISIDPKARLSVGVADGDTLQEFDQVRSPFLLPDGRLVVPLSGASTIRVFTANGVFSKSYGRPGAGPGEFRHVTGAWARGDTIEAFDFRLKRITRFFPNERVEVVKLQTTLPDLSASMGIFGAGWVVGGVAKGGPGRRDSVVIHRFDRTGKDLGAIAQVPGMARYAVGNFRGPEPLSPRSVHAAQDDRVFVAETLTPRIRVFAADNSAVRNIVWQPPRSGAVRPTFDAVVEAAVARAGPDNAASMRQRITSAGVPSNLSVFWHFLVDPRGFVWVKPYDAMTNAFALGAAVGSGGRWLILAQDGRQVGTIDIPAGLEPTFITSDAVVGIARDEFGVESVHVHTLRRR